ncbi:MAG: hypothetical protein BMS9Abin25_1318 [Gammaproteobacteria bacterium]|nr:MAG: hypothetical protein BMS9Abin25_1318 [Gammaproteobacteria bacterium]
MNSLLMNISTALIILALSAGLSALITRKTVWRWMIVTVVIILSLVIPVVGSNPWLWINGATGELSITSLILLAGFVLHKLFGQAILSSSTRRHLYFLILLTGILLFPATLGLTHFDPYVFGYSFELSLLLLSLSVLYWIVKKKQLSLILLIVVVASVAGISSSQNTWDYFIDPMLWLFSPVLLVILLKNKQRTTIFS